jgi:hypothetical protein
MNALDRKFWRRRKRGAMANQDGNRSQANGDQPVTRRWPLAVWVAWSLLVLTIVIILTVWTRW